MDEVVLQTGRWCVSCLPKDGGKLKSLSYAGCELLTAEPVVFRPPTEDYGRYETRPVYGYDDCFPTVDACKDPVTGIDYPDHGEFCWRQWDVEVKANKLICSVESELLAVKFTRILTFFEKELQWQFELENLSGKEISFLHVMHGLMPLEQISSLSLPDCGSLFDEANDREMDIPGYKSISDYLLDLQKGEAVMVLMRDIKQGSIEIGFRSNLKLRIAFDSGLFSTLGIWWNNAGYPDQDGLRRTECAFEPMAGSSSNLEQCCRNDNSMGILSGQSKKWIISWLIRSH